MDLCQASRISLRLSRLAAHPSAKIVRGFHSTRPHNQEDTHTNDAPSSSQSSTPKNVGDLFANAMTPPRPGALGSFDNIAPRRTIPDRARTSELAAGSGSSSLLDGITDALAIQNRKRTGTSQTTVVVEQVVKPLLKLGPNVGRSFRTDNRRGVDVARIFRQLDSACSRNKVRSDFVKQRFHERPGLKRKRIRYEGKIKGFRTRFTKVVQMVQTMTKSGW